MKRIGIVAALPGELKPLAGSWEKQGHIYAGRIGELPAVAVCEGMGAAAVARACERVFDFGPLEALVSMGWAGALSCGLTVGSAYAVREVIDARNGERFQTHSGEGHRLITLDRVADVAEKRRLSHTWQAVMVDMEAAAVARFAAAHRLRFYCFKAISDGPNDKLPDFNRFTRADGRLRMGAFAGYLLLHPQYWRAVGKLEKNSRLAAGDLASLVRRSLNDSQS